MVRYLKSNKEIFPWVNSKVRETFKNKYGLEGLFYYVIIFST